MSGLMERSKLARVYGLLIELNKSTSVEDDTRQDAHSTEAAASQPLKASRRGHYATAAKLEQTEVRQ